MKLGHDISILEYLARWAHCANLSDLRYLDEKRRRALADAVQVFSPGDASLFQWNDALDYLTGAPAETDPVRARARLIALLERAG